LELEEEKEQQMDPVQCRSPPDTQGTPQVPPPQTVEGILQHEGMPAVFKDPPLSGGSIDWNIAGQIWRLHSTSTVSVNDNIGDVVLQHAAAYETDTTSNRVPFLEHYRTLMHACFDFSSYNVEWRFWLVVPDRVVGKYLIRYHPFEPQKTDANTFQPSLRDPVIEWDLAKQSYIDVTFPVYKRFPRIPNRRPNVASIQNVGYPDDVYRRGKWSLEVAAPLRIGSLFPDTYSLFTYSRLIDYNVCSPSDFRIDRPFMITRAAWLSSLEFNDAEP